MCVLNVTLKTHIMSGLILRTHIMSGLCRTFCNWKENINVLWQLPVHPTRLAAKSVRSPNSYAKVRASANLYGTWKNNVSVRRLISAAMLERWPHDLCLDYYQVNGLFHQKRIRWNVLSSKLDSSENLGSFERYLLLHGQIEKLWSEFQIFLSDYLPVA